MPGMGGLDLQDKLREMCIKVPVIIITGYGDVPMAVRAIKNGAVDFIEKPVSDQVLLDHIHHAIAQDLESRKQHEQNREIRERFSHLTSRERQIMELVVEGLSSREIANHLEVSSKTVEAHRARIMRKMEAKNVPYLIQMHSALSNS